MSFPVADDLRAGLRAALAIADALVRNRSGCNSGAFGVSASAATPFRGRAFAPRAAFTREVGAQRVLRGCLKGTSRRERPLTSKRRPDGGESRPPKGDARATRKLPAADEPFDDPDATVAASAGHLTPDLSRDATAGGTGSRVESEWSESGTASREGRAIGGPSEGPNGDRVRAEGRAFKRSPEGTHEVHAGAEGGDPEEPIDSTKRTPRHVQTPAYKRPASGPKKPPPDGETHSHQQPSAKTDPDSAHQLEQLLARDDTGEEKPERGWCRDWKKSPSAGIDEALHHGARRCNADVQREREDRLAEHCRRVEEELRGREKRRSFRGRRCLIVCLTKFDPDTAGFLVHPSATAAAASMGRYCDNIIQAIKRKGTCAGHRFAYFDELAQTGRIVTTAQRRSVFIPHDLAAFQVKCGLVSSQQPKDPT